MENNPLRGLFGASSAPTENIGYEIPSGMIEQLLLPPSIYIGPNAFFKTAFDY